LLNSVAMAASALAGSAMFKWQLRSRSTSSYSIASASAPVVVPGLASEVVSTVSLSFRCLELHLVHHLRQRQCLSVIDILSIVNFVNKPFEFKPGKTHSYGSWKVSSFKLLTPLMLHVFHV
jgi:hypothetical protein